MSAGEATNIHNSSYQHQLLKQYFGFSSFRPLQQDIINAAINGEDTFVCMATASGKSLCYQFPPLLTQKSVVIVSPLISLMEDQVIKMNELRDIKACHISGTQLNNQSIINKALNGEYHLIYISPEKIVNFTSQLKRLYNNKGISLFAIDETHCVSEWGHDFRPEYRNLSCLRKEFPHVPIMALTATATPEVQKDIARNLCLRSPKTFISTFNRPNLFYSCRPKSNSMQEDLKVVLSRCKRTENPDVKIKYNNNNFELEEEASSCIIYCPKINDTEEIAHYLKKYVDAEYYHAKMPDNQRAKVHRAFIKGDVKVVVATVAFGMGIDKPDVRLIVHYGPPRSIESYFQQSGRAGRDGNPSECVLFYSLKDFVTAEYTAKSFSGGDNFEAFRRIGLVRNYCIDPIECRRITLIFAIYFGEKCEQDNCCNCDNCCSPERVLQEVADFSNEAHLLLQVIQDTGNKFGLAVPINVLLGSHAKKISELGLCSLPIHGKGWARNDKWWKELAFLLKKGGYIKDVTKQFYTIIELDSKGRKALRLKEPIILPVTPVLRNKGISANQPSSTAPNGTQMPLASSQSSQRPVGSHVFGQLDPITTELFGALISFRRNISFKKGVPAYSLFTEQTLRKIAEVKPKDLEQLKEIDGMDNKKMQNFGEDILFLVGQFLEDQEEDSKATTTTPNKNRDDNGDASPLTSPFHDSLLSPSTSVHQNIDDNTNNNKFNDFEYDDYDFDMLDIENSIPDLTNNPSSSQNPLFTATTTTTTTTTTTSTPEFDNSNESCNNINNNNEGDGDNKNKHNNNNDNIYHDNNDILKPNKDISNTTEDNTNNNNNIPTNEKNGFMDSIIKHLSNDNSDSPQRISDLSKIDIHSFPAEFFHLVYKVVDHYQTKKTEIKQEEVQKGEPPKQGNEVERAEMVAHQRNEEEKQGSPEEGTYGSSIETADGSLDEQDYVLPKKEKGHNESKKINYSSSTNDNNSQNGWIYASKDEIIVDMTDSESPKSISDGITSKDNIKKEVEVPKLLQREDTEAMSEEELKEVDAVMKNVKTDKYSVVERPRSSLRLRPKNKGGSPLSSTPKGQSPQSTGLKRKLEDRGDDLIDFIEQTIEKAPKVDHDSGGSATPIMSPVQDPLKSPTQDDLPPPASNTSPIKPPITQPKLIINQQTSPSTPSPQDNIGFLPRKRTTPTNTHTLPTNNANTRKKTLLEEYLNDEIDLTSGDLLRYFHEARASASLQPAKKSQKDT